MKRIALILALFAGCAPHHQKTAVAATALATSTIALLAYGASEAY